MRHVVLCDADGNATGTASLEEAHKGEGMLHRAFSVFVFSTEGDRLLLQQRSASKALFPLLWANTCCSHPQQDQEIVAAAAKRLEEEMGFSCPLHIRSSFVYQATDNDRGAEYEYDTILAGKVQADIAVRTREEEVAGWRWATLEELQEELDTEPEQFAPWFPIALGILFANGTGP